MTNRLQHIMILCLYLLFSIFIGVVMITLSDSFYVGAGSFCAFILAFVCGHMFWFGQRTSLMVSMLGNNVQTLENNKIKTQQDIQNNQQEIQSARDVINNITEIISSLITENEEIRSDIFNNKEKSDNDVLSFEEKMSAIDNKIAEFNAKIAELSNHFLNFNEKISLTSQNAMGFDEKIIDFSHEIMRFKTQIADFKEQIKILNDDNQKLTLSMNEMSNMRANLSEMTHNKPNFDDNFIDTAAMPLSKNHIDVRSVTQQKAIYDVKTAPNKTAPKKELLEETPEEYFFTDEFHNTKSDSFLNHTNQKKVISSDEDFLNSASDDDDFSNLSIPVNIHLKNKNLSAIPHNNAEEFATIDSKTADTYRHLLDDMHDEAFLDTIDDHQTKAIRQQLNSSETSDNDVHHKIPDDEESYLDLTQELFNHNARPKTSDVTHTQASDTHNIKVTDNKQAQTKETFPQEMKQKIKSQLDAVPSLNTLIPEEKFKHIAHRSPLAKNIIPSLDTLINKQNSKPSDNGASNVSLSRQDKMSHFKGEQKTSHDSAFEQNIQNAINNNNLVLFTSPVTDNRVREVRFFENNHYIHDDQGHYITPDEFVPLARKKGFSINLDYQMVMRSLHLLDYLRETIHDAAIFCNISILSIFDTEFGNEFITTISQKNVFQNLIMQFPQEELDLLNAVHLEKMIHFTDMGLRFSVDTLKGVLPNLSELLQIGVSFIKLKPVDFMNGVNIEHTIYKNKDIKKICQKNGILVYASQINDHESLLQSVENQADLLQGDLLGEKERSDRLETFAA